jgi:hypothetical protein
MHVTESRTHEEVDLLLVQQITYYRTKLKPVMQLLGSKYLKQFAAFDIQNNLDTMDAN